MDVVPDEVFVSFTIREYTRKGESKTDIDTLKAQFLRACKRAGIADSNINITGYSGYSPVRMKRRSLDFLASITYEVKFSSAATLDQLNAILDDEATGVSYSITRTHHSKAAQFRKELKITALKAAKEKAGYLASAVGEEVGVTITIEEADDDDFRGGFTVGYQVSQASNSARVVSDANDKDGGIAFRRIKYRYTIKAVFALK